MPKGRVETVIGDAAALKAARYHRDNAQSDGIRRYWNAVIRGIKAKNVADDDG